MHTRMIIRKKFRFEMAHQLAAAATAACHETIHGHSYVVEVFIRLRAGAAMEDGMVVDLGDLAFVRDIVNQWDHALVMPDTAPLPYLDMLQKHNKKVIVMSQNPTAEIMAKRMIEEIRRAGCDAAPQCVFFKLRLHETESGYAEVEITE